MVLFLLYTGTNPDKQNKNGHLFTQYIKFIQSISIFLGILYFHLHLTKAKDVFDYILTAVYIKQTCSSDVTCMHILHGSLELCPILNPTLVEIMDAVYTDFVSDHNNRTRFLVLNNDWWFTYAPQRSYSLVRKKQIIGLRWNLMLINYKLRCHSVWNISNITDNKEQWDPRNSNNCTQA